MLVGEQIQNDNNGKNHEAVAITQIISSANKDIGEE